MQPLRRLMLMGLAAAPFARAARAATEPPAASAAGGRPPLFQALDGDWTMIGDVMGAPVTYTLAVRPVLNGTFTELHMTDVQQPPEYEARVFLGYDDESGEVIAHWLDVFGARGSVPHGVGRLTDDSIEFTIAYPGEPFRDVLRRDAAADRWRFVIESADGAGGWKHFAAYELRRA